MMKIPIKFYLLISFAGLFALGHATIAAIPPHSTCKASHYRAVPFSPTQKTALQTKFENWLSRATTGGETTQTSPQPKARLLRDQLQGLTVGSNPLPAMERVNMVINRAVTYRDDIELHSQSDFWETPMNTILRGGDCEDIALLKAAILFHHGWPTDKMHLVIGHATQRGQQIPHAVLLITHGDEYYVMDNLTDQVLPIGQSSILPAYRINTVEQQVFFLPEDHHVHYNATRQTF